MTIDCCPGLLLNWLLAPVPQPGYINERPECFVDLYLMMHVHVNQKTSYHTQPFTHVSAMPCRASIPISSHHIGDLSTGFWQEYAHGSTNSFMFVIFSWSTMQRHGSFPNFATSTTLLMHSPFHMRRISEQITQSITTLVYRPYHSTIVSLRESPNYRPHEGLSPPHLITH